MQPRRTVLAGITTVSLVAAMGLAGPGHAAPEPPEVIEAAGPGGWSQTVMLLSGDQVTYTEHPDGTVAVAVDAADRPGGEPVAFETVDSADGHYVIPTDAWPGLAAGTLDPQLFNVTTLVTDGLAEPDQLPVIVTGAAGAARSASDQTTLESIGGTAIRVGPDDAPALWRSLAPGAEARTASGMRVWLDRAVTVALDESVPQVGVPEVWDAGYDGTGVTVAVLDTGIDPTHPDLPADRIAGTANFTPDPLADGHGHGTHVASTVAGSGEASGGTYRGVAPGASLLVGKVLPDSGTGPTSAVIEGMEWAAGQGADIVNLSLGSSATDGSDPASLALEALTAETGTLFVVATGNDARDAGVGSPAAANSALSVGAVDKEDQLAGYSNRGPRLGDAAVKPELTAPGTGIGAARAAGTSRGTIIDEHYTRLNGTSMATPHVAGAAALLAQAHPDWTWDQLKDALVSTAEPGADYGTFQGGAGRLDAARAVGDRVYGPASVNLGAFPAPYDGARTESLTYRNHTDTPVTLALAVTGHGWDGGDLPDGAVSLEPTTLTVPAGGTASAHLTVHAGPGGVGAYTGLVTAQATSGELRTPFGYYKSVGSHELTVHDLDYLGVPDDGQPIRAVKLDGALPNDPFHTAETMQFSDDEGTARFQVAEGLYDVYGSTVTWDVAADRITSMVATELTVDGDTTVTLDGRDGIRVDPQLPEATDLKAASATYARGFTDGEFGAGFMIQYSPTELYMRPAEHTTGWLEVRGHWTVANSLVSRAQLRTTRQTLPLTPDYHAYYAAPALAGSHDLEVVDGGTGTPEELAAATVAGKVALVRIPIPPDEPNRATHAWFAARDITDAAAQLGAAGVLLYVDVPGAIAIGGLRSESILQLSVPREEGIRARGLLDAAGRAPVRLELDATQRPERLYHLRYLHEDPTLPDPRPVVDVAELVAVPSRYHADQPGQTQRMFSYGFTPREQAGAGLTPTYWAPFEVTEYVLAGEHLRWIRQVTQMGPPGNGAGERLSTRERFLPGEIRGTETWFQSPMRTGAADVPLERRWRDEPCTNCRHGDLFRPGIYYLDSDPRHNERSFFLEGSSYRLFRDGEEIPNQGSVFTPLFEMDPKRATYRLELDGVQPGVPVVRTLAPRIQTAWTFTSKRPVDHARPDGHTCPVGSLAEEAGCAFQPLLVPDYQLDLDLLNRAPAGGTHAFEVTVAPHSGTARGLVRPLLRLELSYSTDGGETWTRADVRRDQLGNRAEVTVAHPPLADTDGYVWLRIDARDVTGNRVEQTVERAYALS